MSTRRLPPRVAFAALPLALIGACADQSPTAPTAGPALSRGGKGPPPAPSGSAVMTVMSGLNSPKGLAFGPEGALYVAETGTATGTGPCVPAGDGGAPACVSNTGSVSRLWKGEQERVATGLPSLAGGEEAVAGPQDVAFQGRGNMYVTIGLGADPRRRAELGEAGASFATLIRVSPNGRWRVVADVGAVEIARNPDQGAIDSNPYGVLAEGGRQYVADAGANAVVEVRANGDAEPVATFAPIPVPPGFPVPAAQAVPTEVVRGPGGVLYVSTLAGFPFVPGTAAIYRVTPGGAPAVFQGGFTSVTDFDVARDGTLYVLQFATGPFLSGPGAVIRVAPDGTRATLTTALAQPTGIAVGPDGAVYVANRGTSAGGGEVLRFAP